MKSFSLASLIFILTLGLASLDADAAKRFGGGGNLGTQRPAPAMKQAAPSNASPAVPAKPAQATPAPGAPQPQPSFMSRWGGMIAGLGIGALLGSMFGGHLGGGIGILLMVLLVAGIGFMLYRLLAARGSPASRPMQYAGVADPEPAARPAFSGIGSRADEPPFEAPNVPPGFQVEPFIRQAKIAFIRLQAANDAKDLSDIRDYTTPEMYAELSMQVHERGDVPQKTEIVSLDAQLVEAVVEGDYEIASVRYTGVIRDAVGANADSFDEVWHVRKDAHDPKGAWLIAGIQQSA